MRLHFSVPPSHSLPATRGATVTSHAPHSKAAGTEQTERLPEGRSRGLQPYFLKTLCGGGGGTAAECHPRGKFLVISCS